MKKKTRLALLGLAIISIFTFQFCDNEDLICPPSTAKECYPLKQVIEDELIIELQPGYTQDMVLDSCNYDFFIFQLATDFLELLPEQIDSVTVLRECNCNLMLLQIHVDESIDINNGHSGSMSPPEDQDDGSGGLIASVGMNFNINIGPVNAPFDTMAINGADSICIKYDTDKDRLGETLASDTTCKGVQLSNITDPNKIERLTIVAGIDTGADPNHSYGRKNVSSVSSSQLLYVSGEANSIFQTMESALPGGEIFIDGLDDNENCITDDLWGVDYFHNDNNPLDRKGHGTHVTGTILSGRIIDNSGIVMMTLQIGGYRGDTIDQEHFSCDLFSIICAIDYAVTNGADVLNMSLGYYSEYYNAPFYRQIRKASEAGMLMVTSAGNDAKNIDGCHHWPSNFSEYFPDHVIAVAALDTFTSTTTAFQLAPFSNYGQHADIAAPGWRIKSAKAGSLDDYVYLSGTSMAAAVVSRRAAMIRDSVLAAGSTITAAQIKTQILSEAEVKLNLCVNGGRALTHRSDTSLLRNIGYLPQ